VLPEALFPTKNNAGKLLRKLSGKNSRGRKYLGMHMYVYSSFFEMPFEL